MPIDKIKKIETEFIKLRNEKSEETLFSIIGGKSTNEKTATRILSFFFDTNREHGMKDLFIRSFLEAAGEEYNSSYPKYEAISEFQTNNGKYIDILLVGKNCNIVIENKIYADLYNDLDEYYKTAKKYEKRKEVKGYVLSPFNTKDKIDKKKGNGKNFKSVTYTDFLEKLELNCKKYDIPNSKYKILYDDFIDNMRFLVDKKINIDTQIWKDFKDVYKKVNKEVKKDANEQRVAILKYKIKELENQLENDFAKKEQLDLKEWNTKNLKNINCSDENAYQAGVFFDFPNKQTRICQPNIVISLLNGISINLQHCKKDLIEKLNKGKKGEMHQDGNYYLYRENNSTQFDIKTKVADISRFISKFLNELENI